MTARAPHRPYSVEAAISDRLTGDTLRRAIIRAFMADVLTLQEIADEFGCHVSYVKRITQALGDVRCRVRRRRRNAG